MQDQVSATPMTPKRVPWNKGKLTGQSRRCGSSMFGRSEPSSRSKVEFVTSPCLAIDSKFRGCDVVAIRVEDVAASGYTADRATV